MMDRSPSNSKERINQILDIYSNLPENLVHFALKKYSWDVERVVLLLSDEVQLNELRKQAIKEGIVLVESSTQNKGTDPTKSSTPPLNPVLFLPSTLFFFLSLSLSLSSGTEKIDSSCQDDETLPSRILSDHQKYFECLFQLLSLNDEYICARTWELLRRLPTARFVLDFNTYNISIFFNVFCIFVFCLMIE
jgi:hypothetical protein